VEDGAVNDRGHGGRRTSDVNDLSGEVKHHEDDHVVGIDDTRDDQLKLPSFSGITTWLTQSKWNPADGGSEDGRGPALSIIGSMT